MNRHCIEFTDTYGAAQLVDVLEVAHGTADATSGTCMCPDGYEIWVPQSYEHANAVFQEVPDAFKTAAGWTAPTQTYFTYATTSCTNYLCSRAGLHQFSVTQESGSAADVIQEGVWPRFKYTANEDAEVHFLDTEKQTLFARLVHGATPVPASYVNGLPIVASVERCDWEIPAWTLWGAASVELGAAEFEVRTLGEDEVDEAKYYYPYGDLSNTDHGLVVHDCDPDPNGLTVLCVSSSDSGP